jgi:hypothetical protein
MDSTTKTIPLTLKDSYIHKESSFFSTVYGDCVQSDLRDVYHQIEQYHNCQGFEGNCDMCIYEAGGCQECLKMTYQFIRDCSIIIDKIDDEFFSETMTEEEWKLYWNLKDI